MSSSTRRTGRLRDEDGLLKRWRVAGETAGLVAVLALVKLVIDYFSLEFITLNALYSSVVAGGIFVIGLIVAGTLADYKESEKMPAEIAGALENIYQDAVSIKTTEAAFDLVRLREQLVNVVVTLKSDLARAGERCCLVAINDLSEPILQLERLGVPANYIVRLRTEQGLIRRTVFRIYHIERIQFLPSAYVLIQTVVGLIIAALELTKLEPLYEAMAILVLISYFFLYLERLLRIMDTPFREDEHTMDDVSLFLLNEFVQRLTPLG